MSVVGHSFLLLPPPASATEYILFIPTSYRKFPTNTLSRTNQEKPLSPVENLPSFAERFLTMHRLAFHRARHFLADELPCR